MKRFLSWITLIGCFIIFYIIVHLDTILLYYLLSLYDQLSAFLKLVVIFFGGSFFLGIAFAPLWYGIPITYTACETICPSKHGDRYVVMGVLIIALCIRDILSGFMIEDILIGIYGIVLLLYGRNHSKK